MGTSYSCHNLGNECTSFEAGPQGAVARWGDLFEVSAGNWIEDSTEKWGVSYNEGPEIDMGSENWIERRRERKRCGYQLRATRDKDGVENISFGINDKETSFSLEITRVGRYDLRGGIRGITSKHPPKLFSRAKQGYTIETTVVPSYSSYRDSLFVLEMKKKVNSEGAYMVTMAHYFVTKDVGISVTAKFRYKRGNGFVVKVEGPFCHPSADLRSVIIQTCHTGIWSPDACSHCNGANRQGQDTFGPFLNNFLPRNIRDQYNRGFINSSGSTRGDLNHSIIFMNFPKYRSI